MSGFDVEMYFLALDEERVKRGLTWAALTRELNAPFAHRPDIPPIATSTVTGMRAKGGLNGNTVVHTMMWLGRAPEDFAPGHPVAPKPLPRLRKGFLPRWDTTALLSVVDAQRADQKLTWTEAAQKVGEHGGRYSAGSLRNLKAGFPHVMGVLAWLQRPAADFVINVPV